MKDKLLIIGASGHGKVVADIALKMGNWKHIAFLDDNESLTSAVGIEVIGRSTDVFKYIEDWDFFVGIGNNTVRERIQEELEAKGASLAILIHPSAIIGEETKLASGTAIMAGTVINCCTTIGKGCIINTGSTIDHDNIIEDYVHISPGVHIAGTVHVGRSVWLGVGSVVSNNITIIAGCKIGAGTVVVKDIIDSATYVGVPARKL